VDVVSHRTQDFPEPLGGDLHAFFGMLMIISVPFGFQLGLVTSPDEQSVEFPEDGA
jgi:hypothetical protein